MMFGQDLWLAEVQIYLGLSYSLVMTSLLCFVLLTWRSLKKARRSLSQIGSSSDVP